MTILSAPPGRLSLPAFDDGWVIEGERRAPFLSYTDQVSLNWSDELELLHEEASRTHFLDVWTRGAIVRRLGPLAPEATIADLGCSTGYLLEDIRTQYPKATLIGIDLVASGLAKAHTLVPSARLAQANVCALPLEDASLHGVVSANLLEHVPEDHAALAEIRRVLRPGGRAVVVVPAGPGTYDYYDRFLGHERRYARRELARKARGAGFEVLEDVYLASLLYPAFWLVKQRNRRKYDHLEGDALEQRVTEDIAATADSRIGRMLWHLEERLPVRLPFGIRDLVVLQRSER
jgi:ubiquinone/menaquinone biosynthesis C-methylase UbiE